MSHQLRFAFAAALGLAYLTDTAYASPTVDADHAHEKAPAKGGKGKGKGGGKKNKEDYVGPIKKEKYPVQERLRPLTLSKQMVQGTLDLGVGPILKGVDSTPVGASLDIAYGLAPVVDAHISTGFAFAPDAAWSHLLSLGVGYLAYDSHDYDLAVRVDANLQLQDGGQNNITVAVPMRYLAGDYFDIHGSVGVPIFTNPDFYVAITLLPGVGVQPSDHVYLSLDTLVATLALANSDVAGSTWLGDVWPISFSAEYAINKSWDLGARLTDGNLLHPDEIIGLDLFVKGRF